VGFSLPQFPDGHLLTHSAVKCWNACRRRYYFAYILGVRRAFRSIPLRMGGIWHLGVGEYESGTPIETAVSMIRQAYADEPCPACLSQVEYEVEEETVIAMVLGHYDRYRDDQIIKSIAVEKMFAVPIINPDTGRPTPSFESAGMVDRIGALPDQTTAVVERKTTSESIEPESPYWKALRNDPQISRYMLATKALGFDVTKVIYDVVKKPAIRPRQVTKAEVALANRDGHYCGLALEGPCPERETPKMYGARLRADMKARPDFYFARNEIARTDGDLEEFQYDLWQTQQEIRQAMNNGRFYRNPASCLEPFTCDYLDVCHELCADPANIPSGFRRAERLHEEIPLPAEPVAV
jgi:hypothetical protein